jgi:hypothetical protein
MNMHEIKAVMSMYYSHVHDLLTAQNVTRLTMKPMVWCPAPRSTPDSTAFKLQACAQLCTSPN